MQVNSTTSISYYTSYRSNTSVRSTTGFTQTWEDIHSTDMSIHESGLAENVVNEDAVTIAESEEEGEFLGITMVPEEGESVTYGMRAMLSAKSTPANPIVQVISNLGGKKEVYNVDINKVNPENATQLEMFALLSYADKKGLTDGGTFGSYKQLKTCAENANLNGYCGSLSGETVFLNEKFDWPDIIGKMMSDYLDAEMNHQYESCKNLLSYFGAAKSEGTSFIDLMGSDAWKKNSIPTVNQIVSAKNPEDGEIYLTYFTDEKISCHDATGKKVWELEIANQEQADMVKAFFEKYEPDREQVQEYYSDEAMGIAASRDFWVNQFHESIVNQYGDIFGDEKVTKVIEMGVVSLSSGESLHFNYDTDEVSLVEDAPRGETLWTLPISKEDQERSLELLERFPYDGHLEYRYADYLRQESFWEKYLNGEIDLKTLLQED